MGTNKYNKAKEVKPNEFVRDQNINFVLKKNLTNNVNYSGIYNSNTYEVKTFYDKASGETVIDSNANAFIVLGRDRDAGVSSGFGGIGHSGASCIDIIVGHLGPKPIDKINDKIILTQKNFKLDATRLYLSQRSNIDGYFGIPKIGAKIGNVVLDIDDSYAAAAAALKSDTVRLIARHNVKIVTHHDIFNTISVRPTRGGIDILAGCNKMKADKTLLPQPMVKGNNLIQLLKEIIARIDDVQTTVTNFMNTQKEINDIFSSHTHQSNKAGLSTSGIVGKEASLKNFKLLSEVIPDIIQNHISNVSIDGSYFEPFHEKYINSIWNRVN